MASRLSSAHAHPYSDGETVFNRTHHPNLFFYMGILFLSLYIFVQICGYGVAAQETEQEVVQDEILEATVEHVAEEDEIEVMGQLQLYQKLELSISSGPRAGEIIIVENGNLPLVNARRYKVGDRVFVRSSGELVGEDETEEFYIDIPSRWLALAGVGLVLVLVTIAVSGRRGAAALFGLVISFVVLFVYILPRLAAGAEPLRVILLGAAIIVPPTFYLAHGLSLKTTVAIIATVLALVLTIALASLFINLTQLTGYGSEDAAFLQALSPGGYDIRSLLLAGIVVGVLGVLDDVTVSQAAIVQQLRNANSALGVRDLYRRAMQVGQDHITSMVNTLVLVYAGASLPLLLLLRTSSLPLTYLLSQEIIAEEIVRMIVSSIGLMAAVPLTTLLAAAVETHRPRLLDQDTESA